MRSFFGGLAVVVSSALLGQFAGCGEGLKNIDEINNPSDDAALAKCRAEARADMQIYGNADRAWNVYLACTADAGLR